MTNEANIIARDGSKAILNVYDRQVEEGKRLLECLDKAKPNVRTVFDNFEEQLKQIREEIESDKPFREAVQIL